MMKIYSDRRLIDGIQFVYDHMFDSLKSHGVEKITSVGQPFEPGKHEAMMQRAEPDKPDNIVLEEFQTGFFTHAAEFTADMPNYTDLVPQVQISEIVK